MSGLKKAGKALKEAYQDALPGKRLDTKPITVSHTTHEGDTLESGEVVVHIGGPEKDIAEAYSKLFPSDALDLPHPSGTIVYSAKVDRSVDGETHKLTIHHQVTTY